MMLPKPKIVKLKGKAKSDLRDAIFERDGYSCVICHYKATEWHHQPYGAYKSDELEKGVALCTTCHDDLHKHPKLGPIYYQLVEDYLTKLYGERNKYR